MDTFSIRLAELMAALSLVTDLGMGQPLEYALSSCVLSMRLGEALKLDETQLREVYYQALLRYIGCNVETHLLATIVGDEMALRHDIAQVDTADTLAIVNLFARFIRQANTDASPLQLARLIAQGVLSMPRIKNSFVGHCEVAQRLAERFGFDHSIVRGLGQLYARWDGRGVPAVQGEDIATAVRVVTLAQDAVIFHQLGGVQAAVAIARERKGAAYAPDVVECFCQHAPQLMTGLDREPTWEAVLALEPGKQTFLSDEQFDAACRAIADFVDIKSPFLLGHSAGVGDLAAKAGRRAGLPPDDVIALRRAGLLHDLGRTGVSAGIWEKPGPLSEREWEQVRMHPYHTERVLARPAALARLGTLASLHHERLNGSGYHRSLPAAMLSPSARILAAADAYHAMIEPRPYRPARLPEQVADELRRETRSGRLDGDAVQAVLAAAGQHVSGARRELVAGLSEREVEVLQLLARGQTMKQIADKLVISKKDGRQSHSAYLQQDQCVYSRRGDPVCARAQPVAGRRAK